MSLFTLLLFLFVIIMFLYLNLVRKEVRIATLRRKNTSIIIVGLSILTIWMSITTYTTLDDRVRGVLAALIFLSFLLDRKGLTDERIILNVFDRRGVAYSEIDRIVLYQNKESNEVKLNFFRSGLRGPLLKFSIPMEELVLFLSTKLKEDADLEIIIE
ncbi:hypothetical protein [Enterococcus phoeniculicola]|jgi:hypothetical protein|uniref:DUF5673 domain-containing protein n=1 Tax=Enterococcus phoeniculicola ATCC BAA-412 TaxID=1158610 RepID=R3WE18_9ENTE|nr:hypothetical protein [Enterococcus phoeniculicola]EOL46106.1 hypothetical protein UC3_00912 [Enterococcus phoeniculicola ATCC BAA-412]EOT77049.1 hypothetical protein I589_02010 [Enterococcus phoeniculicola ATCC BAA-412]